MALTSRILLLLIEWEGRRRRRRKFKKKVREATLEQARLTDLRLEVERRQSEKKT